METKQFIRALRAVADMWEAHPELPAPEPFVMSVFGWNGREQMKRAAEMLATCQKQVLPDYSLFKLIHDFGGGVRVAFVSTLDAICTRQVKGTRHVPEKTLPALTIAAHDEEVVEWNCGEPLFGVK